MLLLFYDIGTLSIWLCVCEYQSKMYRQFWTQTHRKKREVTVYGQKRRKKNFEPKNRESAKTNPKFQDRLTDLSFQFYISHSASVETHSVRAFWQTVKFDAYFHIYVICESWWNGGELYDVGLNKSLNFFFSLFEIGEWMIHTHTQEKSIKKQDTCMWETFWFIFYKWRHNPEISKKFI